MCVLLKDEHWNFYSDSIKNTNNRTSSTNIRILYSIKEFNLKCTRKSSQILILFYFSFKQWPSRYIMKGIMVEIIR